MLHVNIFGRNAAVHVILTLLCLFADATCTGVYHSCLLCHAGNDNYYLRACLLSRGHQMRASGHEQDRAQHVGTIYPVKVLLVFFVSCVHINHEEW